MDTSKASVKTVEEKDVKVEVITRMQTTSVSKEKCKEKVNVKPDASNIQTKTPVVEKCDAVGNTLEVKTVTTDTPAPPAIVEKTVEKKPLDTPTTPVIQGTTVEEKVVEKKASDTPAPPAIVEKTMEEKSVEKKPFHTPAPPAIVETAVEKVVEKKALDTPAPPAIVETILEDKVVEKKALDIPQEKNAEKATADKQQKQVDIEKKTSPSKITEAIEETSDNDKKEKDAPKPLSIISPPEDTTGKSVTVDNVEKHDSVNKQIDKECTGTKATTLSTKEKDTSPEPKKDEPKENIKESPAKVNSSLVLYSESSDSSNDATDTQPQVSKTVDKEPSNVVGTAGQKSENVNAKDVNSCSALSADASNKNNGGVDSMQKEIAVTGVSSAKDPATGSVPEGSGAKRKAEEEIEEPVSKIPKMDDNNVKSNAEVTAANPIVGETVEEKVIIVSGEGSGAMNEGQNSPCLENPICGETIEEEVMFFAGDGFGVLNQGSNENSPIPIAVPDTVISQNESGESDEEESRDAFPAARGRGGRRGRGRRGRPAGSTAGRGREASSTPRNTNRGSRGSREVAGLGVSMDNAEVNGDNDRPVRASRRIAQIRLKEEEERRKLEEERLAQLKAAQMRKKAKQEEKDKTDDQSGVKSKKGKKQKNDDVQFGTEYIPSGTESEDNYEEEDGSDEDEFTAGKGKQRKKRKNGKAKKGGNPWATDDEDDEEQVEEEEEEYHYEEEEEEELVFKSDHEFSPESDLGEDDDAGPSRHARTAKQDKGSLFEEGNCCKCGKGDHPEWILLCDKCDKGWHASCLRPQLWVVPEGEWFCPPCQHNMLIDNLGKNLIEYEILLKKRENEILRKQRLAYVGISLDNVLPDKEPKAPEPEIEQDEKSDRDKKRQRRRILSDEELSDDFINDGESDDDLSRSRSGSSDNSEDEPVYRLRPRRTKKAFNFKEYDDMINSAIRVDDDEKMEQDEDLDEEDEDEEDEDKKLNGDDIEDDDDGGAGGGKNESYLKHLEEQKAQEDDETDEELLDEKERLRRKELKKNVQKKTRRRINDLDAFSDEEDSDDDFKASEAEDEEELAEEGESEWSGDKMEEDSDDSIAKRARRKDRQGRHRRLGRREKYSDKGLVRRSTRKRRSRISYDESDDDEDDEDQNDKWQSDESEEEEESESNSDSEDSSWGKRKKKEKPKLSNFVLSGSPAKPKAAPVKRKRRKTDDDDVDKAWSGRGKKEKDEPVERRTRGRKINFKDILDSGESDDEGNVRPKRRPLSDSDDSRSPSSSRRLAEEIRAENARQAKEYEERQAKHVDNDEEEEIVTAKDITITKNDGPLPPNIPESLTIAKMAESSVNKPISSALLKATLTAAPHLTPPHVAPMSPNNLTPISSPSTAPSPSTTPVLPPSVTAALSMSQNSSPVHIPSSTPPILPPSIVEIPPKSKSKKSSALSSDLSKSSPMPLVSKTISPDISSAGPIPPILAGGILPLTGMVGVPNMSIPPKITSPGSIPTNLRMGPGPLNIPMGLSSKLISSIPPPVPVPISNDKKPPKQPKSSRGSRGSKSDKLQPPPPPVASPPSDLELALTKPLKSSPQLPASLSKSSKKKDREREREASLNVPNPSLLTAGVTGVLPELLGVGLPSSLRQGPPPPTSSSSSSKKSKHSSRTTQQTTPPPVSQNLSPSLPIDIDRVPNPALFAGNPGMRPFHPMWAVRNPGPPPQGYSPSGSPIPGVLGKPPPLNTSPFSQQGPPSRPGFPPPPPLRIPNPNTSPLQAFQHFKRDNPLGAPLYRLATGQPQPGVPISSILPPGMMSPHTGGPERFFGAPPGYPNPYGMLPPHSQGPPQALFPFDYRPSPEPPFKEEPLPPRTSSSSLPTPVSSASSSPPPTAPVSVPLPSKDEGSSARDSEFGGLVSYFISQRSEEDMDT